MTRADRWSIVTAVSVFSVVAAAGFRAAEPFPQTSQSLSPEPARLTEMRHHFADVLLVHEAVIRGDLPSVRAPAQRVAAVAMPAGMPPAAAPFLDDIRKAGQRAAEATTLPTAARATVAMVAACAGCHRATGVFPIPAPPVSHDIGGVVGHMQEHQRAADDLLVGLVTPSVLRWRDGADRLRVAALLPAKFPKDPKLTKEIRQADIRVHQLADRAIDAETDAERTSVYTELLASCAQCHSLHSRIWGPGRGGRQP